jgi:tRNA threonylcarbamoyladenosine biosynthesis protein TsaE
VRELACVSRAPEETRAIARAIASLLGAGDLVLLAGDLGAGKTCFVQGAAAALGARDHVASPSFVIVREYRGDVRIVHADAYRLTSLQELLDLGEETLLSADAITFVEWGDAVEGVLPAERLEVEIRAGADERRLIAVRARTAAWEGRLAEIAARLREWAA